MENCLLLFEVQLFCRCCKLHSDVVPGAFPLEHRTTRGGESEFYSNSLEPEQEPELHFHYFASGLCSMQSMLHHGHVGPYVLSSDHLYVFCCVPMHAVPICNFVLSVHCIIRGPCSNLHDRHDVDYLIIRE